MTRISVGQFDTNFLQFCRSNSSSLLSNCNGTYATKVRPILSHGSLLVAFPLWRHGTTASCTCVVWEDERIHVSTGTTLIHERINVSTGTFRLSLSNKEKYQIWMDKTATGIRNETRKLQSKSGTRGSGSALFISWHVIIFCIFCHSDCHRTVSWCFLMFLSDFRINFGSWDLRASWCGVPLILAPCSWIRRGTRGTCGLHAFVPTCPNSLCPEMSSTVKVVFIDVYWFLIFFDGVLFLDIMDVLDRVDSHSYGLKKRCVACLDPWPFLLHNKRKIEQVRVWCYLWFLTPQRFGTQNCIVCVR